MHFRLVLIAAVLCGATYGCATPEEAKGQASATESPAPQREGSYRTGSRLPSYDSEGSSSTGAQSKDDFTDQMNRGTTGRSPGMAP